MRAGWMYAWRSHRARLISWAHVIASGHFTARLHSRSFARSRSCSYAFGVRTVQASSSGARSTRLSHRFMRRFPCLPAIVRRPTFTPAQPNLYYAHPHPCARTPQTGQSLSIFALGPCFDPSLCICFFRDARYKQLHRHNALHDGDSLKTAHDQAPSLSCLSPVNPPPPPPLRRTWSL